MPIYRSAENPRPDDEFEPGALRHLAPGAHGRLLDPRRTPVSVVAIDPVTGFVDIHIEDFEDRGATWEIPFERVGDFQFELDGPLVPDATVAEMESAIERLSGAQTIDADPSALEQTESCVADREFYASEWLDRHSRFLAERDALPDPSSRRGDPLLAADLEAWLHERGALEMEQTFSRVFVSNPASGEVVKGHRIVLAEYGLADYTGPVVRDPATFEGDWSRERRAEHIVERLAFLRALFTRFGRRSVTLWRGASIEERLEVRLGRTFVSTSFDEAVARSHFESGAADWTHVLVRQDVPIARLFMTYHETAAMNTIFLEAEGVVLARTRDDWP